MKQTIEKPHPTASERVSSINTLCQETTRISCIVNYLHLLTPRHQTQ